MWLATKYGFFSIVKKGGEPTPWQCRSRTRVDIENAARLAHIPKEQIRETFNSDYRFRIFLNKTDLGMLMAAFAETVDYSNFKDKIKDTENQRGKLHVYHQIWGIMEQFQPSRYFKESYHPTLRYDDPADMELRYQNASEANVEPAPTKKKKPSGAFWRRKKKEREQSAHMAALRDDIFWR